MKKPHELPEILKAFSRTSYQKLQQDFGLERLINFADNENVFGASPNVLKAFSQNLLQCISTYPDPECWDLRKHLSKFHEISPENIFIGRGAMEIIRYLLLLGDRSAAMVSPYGSFIQYKIASAVLEIPIIEASLNEYSINGDEIISLAKKAKAQWVFVSNPNNPTGTALSIKQIEHILQEIPTSCTLVVDEAYLEYAEASGITSATILLKKFNNLLVLKSFSKSYGLPGLRIGYLIGSPETIKMLELIAPPFLVDQFSQDAAVLAIDDEKFMKASIQKTRDLKKQFVLLLEEAGLTCLPSEANFFMVDLSDKDADSIFLDLKKQGFLVKNMSNYGFKGFHRISVRFENENKLLVQAYQKALGNISRP